jgi:hypothetical protein
MHYKQLLASPTNPMLSFNRFCHICEAIQNLSDYFPYAAIIRSELQAMLDKSKHCLITDEVIQQIYNDYMLTY